MSSSSESPSDTATLDSGVSSVKPDCAESLDENVLPKVEELELSLSDIKSEVAADALPISPTEPVRVRRARGRPRIHPQRSPTTSSSAKARSKTGCITCRKRKKKCDETKPFCQSCKKNNIHCEGYKPVELWKSGKEREAEARRASLDVKYELPPLMEGVENDVDRILLQHFVTRASCVLSLDGNHSNNPFTKILLPMALKHEGLMHSVLCLSASHFCSVNPSREHQERQAYHRGRALHLLHHDLERQKAGGDGGNIIFEDHNVAQILVHLLNTICEGSTDGEYRMHLQAAKKIVMSQKSKNGDFQCLIDEFVYYHWIASEVTSLEGTEIRMMDDFNLPFTLNPETAGMIGVSDGLFGFMSKISGLRRRIRQRIDTGQEPAMDYEAFHAAHAIDTGLRSWQCPQTPGTPRYTISMLYRQAAWVYLYRTTKESKPHPYISTAVDNGIRYIKELPAEGWIQSNVLLPLFLIGCAAFEEQQRVEVERAFQGLMACTGLGNIASAKEVVEEVWRLMDRGDPDSWDWEKIINARGWDFLAT
ncbi:uncharacterized protein EI97DRAFT_462241 [Westerdykella ornata]|uniref:Zn(2)-C6 fungal-type domain-containing protein n=1 Tax=Westerdykella ornata TaxID=318751 RepID=A0A6A6J6E1_WESOR|nr:uncharacterized protein EI97DRAFT_462241 [Westerdykella ornata]KAF2272141.1 hypothetical protein EI97DRAFT_462241 [Westerdykella ornata]